MSVDFPFLPLCIVECSWVPDRLYIPGFVMIQTIPPGRMYVLESAAVVFVVAIIVLVFVSLTVQ